MTLADRIAAYREPFRVQDCNSGAVTLLNGPAESAALLRACAQRYVLADDLTRLCVALAYSHGARTLECADLLRIPARRLWLEWNEQPWQRGLAAQGFPVCDPRGHGGGGRRGALLSASADGRRGLLRTFWTADDGGVLASSMEAFFDLDTPEDEEPEAPDGGWGGVGVGAGTGGEDGVSVGDGELAGGGMLARCFRFRYERSWANYYAGLLPEAAAAVRRHSLGTIALDVPLVLTFFLLLATRTSLPCRPSDLSRLNHARLRRGRMPLLEHVQATCPLLPALAQPHDGDAAGWRRGPRLHQVRGHLFRRGGALHWRVAHLRGHARAGAVATRTVTWTF
ncbi:MAG: hypothetical protein JSR67_14435 [Proteobacteria bacterium]|nr:hypothetical protein [Pseudomonadota bacterium]